MNKILFFASFSVFAILLSNVYALELDMKNSYKLGETTIVEVKGAVDIEKDNFQVKRNNVNIPVEYDLKRLGDRYFVWFISPQNTNNYTLWIKNVSTYYLGNKIYSDYSFNFSVIGEVIDYNINP